MSEDIGKPNQILDFDLHHEGLLRSYLDHGHALRQMQNYSGAIQSFQRALDVAIGLFGEEHPDTAECYFSIGVTQHALGNFSSARQSTQRGLDITRRRLFGEEHRDTAES